MKVQVRLSFPDSHVETRQIEKPLPPALAAWAQDTPEAMNDGIRAGYAHIIFESRDSDYVSTGVDLRDVLPPCLNGHAPGPLMYGLTRHGPWLCDLCRTQSPATGAMTVSDWINRVVASGGDGKAPALWEYIACLIAGPASFTTNSLGEDNPYLRVTDLDAMAHVLSAEANGEVGSKYVVLFFDRTAKGWNEVPGVFYWMPGANIALLVWHEMTWWTGEAKTPVDAVVWINKYIRPSFPV